MPKGPLTWAEDDAMKRIEELEAEKKALEDYKALTCKLIPDAEKEARCIFAQNSMEYSREKPSNMEGAIKQVAEHFAMRDARIEQLREALEAAPEPETETNLMHQFPVWPIYTDWWEDVRSKALEEGE